jgi:hypothetical protein
VTATLPQLFGELAFQGTWRRYQKAALAAFERDRAAGHRRTHLVAPPGSGKTLIGVELVRRIGRRALVLAPDGAVQMQWPRAVRQFAAPAVVARTAGPEPAFPIACMTYRSLCELADPEVALERLAAARRGDAGVDLAELLSASANARVTALRAARIGAVVLDECHHLASTWGDVVRAVLDELGGEDVHVIGLTATPPSDDAGPYAELLGPVDFTIPTPAVVRDGHLAPYQELAWLTEPLEPERAWLAERELAPEVDRMLTHSQAKAHGLVEVLAAEAASRGGALRAVVLCDAEQADGGDRLLAGVLDPASGTARHALLALGADARTAPLRPLVVAGRGLFCLPADADVLLAALVEQAHEHLALPEWSAEPDGVLVSLRSSGAEWVQRAWVELATRVLESGACGVLVGTHALLGERWECAAVNCLVDLTASATGVSLRLDPRDREKLASNWDVVCAAPDLVRGAADYERFARKHRHLYAPAEDGALEAGPSHVHAELTPCAPPPAARFADLNRATLARAAARDEARERWRLGEPYRGVELRTAVVRPPAGAAAGHAGAPPLSQRLPLAVAAAGVAIAAVATIAAGVAGLAALALTAAGLGWAALRLRRARDRLPVVLGLESAARAVADAYRELGELSPEAAGSLAIEPRGSGYVRCLPAEATPEESARFVTALCELLSVAPDPRRLVARPVPDPAAGAATMLARVLRRRPPFPVRHHAIPSDLGRDDARAAAFARAWARHVGPTRIVAGAAAEDGGYETLTRVVWV